MLKHCLTYILCLTLLTSVAEVKIEAFEKGKDRYWLIYDVQKMSQNDHLIVFLHGFAASNPACYGGWINELVMQGNPVLFPKFQNGIFLPATQKFQNRVDCSIRKTLDHLKSEKGLSIRKITFVTHSIGGIIGANLADKYGKSGDLKVGGIALIQPGFQFLKLGRLKGYKDIDPEVKILIVTGAQDRIAGDGFARHFYSTSDQIPTDQKLWLKHFSDRSDGNKITAKHKDPISPFPKLDTYNRNFVIQGSFWLCKTDEVDLYAYWLPTMALIQDIDSKQWSNTEELTYMGQWSDGHRIRTMKVVH